jgi:F1F0 ATPase subunit 2
MIDVFHISIAFAAGLLLGLFYFGTLWLTVRHLPKTRMPALWALGSFFARTGITLFGFYLATAGHWERLLVCLLGFMAMRKFLVRHWKPERTNLLAK